MYGQSVHLLSSFVSRISARVLQLEKASVSSTLYRIQPDGRGEEERVLGLRFDGKRESEGLKGRGGSFQIGRRRGRVRVRVRMRGRGSGGIESSNMR